MWIYLSPYERSLLQDRPVRGEGEHAQLLRDIIGRIQGDEVTITAAEFLRLLAAQRNWRLGYEQQITALITAARRSGN